MLPTVAICLPSRGLLHSRTLEAVLAALETATSRIQCVGWFMTHDLPIPDCHETTAEQALAAGAEYVWFVEEDMIPPPDALIRLLATQRQTGAGIVYMDYPVGEHPTQSAILRQPNGALAVGGLGCTLITRAVFEALPRPWFDCSHEYALSRASDGRSILTRTARACGYGGHDVALAQAALSHGFTIDAVPDMIAGHARLRSWGAQHTNAGAHVVDVLTDIEREWR